MTAPNFLSSDVEPFRYAAWTGSDVAGLLTAIETEIGNAALGPWTESPADTWACPTNGTAYMKITMSRTSATRLNLIAKDDHDTVIRNGDIDIESSGNTTVDIFAGKHYLVLQSRRATRETWLAGMVDPSPDAAANVPNPVYGGSYRVGAGTAALYNLSMIDNLSMVNNFRIIVPQGSSSAVYPPNWTMPSGRNYFSDVMIAQNVGGTIYQVGRLPQILIGNSALGWETNHTIPVDDGTTGVFWKINLNVGAYLLYPPNCYLFVRKA